MNALRHGLFIQRVLQRLRRVGIELNPYFLYREGVLPHRISWPELAREFPSSVLDATHSADVVAIGSFDAWRTAERIHERLEKGHLCVILKNNGRVAGFTWADLDEVNDVTCDYELGSDEAYLYDAFIAPEFRGRSLAPYMRAESYRHLRQFGRNTFYSISEAFNTPAIKFKEKLNAERARLYFQIKIGGREVGHWLLKDYDKRRANVAAGARVDM